MAKPPLENGYDYYERLLERYGTATKRTAWFLLLINLVGLSILTAACVFSGTYGFVPVFTAVTVILAIARFDPTYAAQARSLLRLIRCHDFPRLWNLSAYILDHKTREKIYQPAAEELIEDFLESRRKYRTPWARRWLTLCFTLRTLFLFSACFRNMVGTAALNFLVGWLPAPIREAFRRLLRIN
jgi:hypothetical protein